MENFFVLFLKFKPSVNFVNYISYYIVSYFAMWWTMMIISLVLKV